MNGRTAAMVFTDSMTLSAAAPRNRPLALACAALGFACACPLLLVSGVNMRLSDVACAVACVLAVWDLLRRGRRHSGAGRLAAILASENSSRMVLVRWMLALPAGYWLCICTENPALRRATLWGFCGGWCTDTVLLAYDFVTFQATGFPAFTLDASRVTWVGNDYRAIGIFDHPNPAAIGSLFLVQLLIGLAEEGGSHGLAILLGWIATFGVFYVTRSRGAALTVSGLLLYWSLARMRRMAKLVALLAVLGAAALCLCWPAGVDALVTRPDVTAMLARFTNSEALRENSAGRSDTILASLQLLRTHPLGMGSTYGPMLHDLTGAFDVTHNGLLQFALLGGLPLALITLAAFLRGAWQVWQRHAVTEHWLALYVLGTAMFEEICHIPTASIITLWLIAQLGWPLFGPRRSPLARAPAGNPSWPR